MKLLCSLALGLSLIWLALSQVPGQDTAAAAAPVDLPAAFSHTSQPLALTSFTQTAKLIASDRITNDRFGYSVVVSGDTVAVGADLAGDDRPGAAYVFVKPAGGWSGILTQTAKLIASDTTSQAQLGWSIAMSGDTIVVGALGDSSAYVFVKPPGGWSGVMTETAKLTALDGDTSQFFGDSVAIEGDTVVVVSRGLNKHGAAYVYHKPPGGWVAISTFSAKLIPSAGVWGSPYITPMAMSNDIVVVGAAGYGVVSNPSLGSAYLFMKPSGGWSGVLTETAKLIASDGEAEDTFGLSTAISHDTVVIGAVGDDVGSNNNQGSAYVFVKPAKGWSGILTETAKLIASDGVLNGGSGFSVAAGANTILVSRGAGISNTNPGTVDVFFKPSGGWRGLLTETTKLTASDGTVNGRFGHAVAISGNTIAVGALGPDDSYTGSAYLFISDALNPLPEHPAYLPVIRR